MKILVLNAGSSSLKFELYETDQLLDSGMIERVTDWPDALRHAFLKLTAALGCEAVAAVGHRVVHGGTMPEAMVVDAEVERAIEDLCDLAPLHNPRALAAIRAARQHLPDAVHVAVFDTGFHQTLPRHAYAYAMPAELLDGGKIRRYGFHGISHRSVAQRFAQIHGRTPAEFRLITCHLGNGCSVCAIDRGKAIDTSMGFTPLEGLVMGTRSGDMDASALLHLITRCGVEPAALLNTLNNKSGLLALSGVSNDMRDVYEAAMSGNADARTAVDAFCYRIKKYIGAYLAAMNGADALVFTAGIGENAAGIRAEICAGLNELGIELDPSANARTSSEARRIGAGKVEVWVVPTEEGRMIARDARDAVDKLSSR